MKVLIKGNYGNNNMGDDAIALCIYKELANRGIYTKIMYKKNVANPYNLPVYNYTISPTKQFVKFFELIEVAFKHNYLIYGGGSQIQLKSGLNNILITTMLFKLFKKKVIFFGVGIEDIHHSKENLSILQKIINLSDYFSVRDRNSLNITKELSLNKTVKFSSDQVINLHNILSLKTTIENNKKGLNITIIPMDFPALYVLVDEILKYINERIGKTISITVIPFAKVDEYAVSEIIKFIKKNDYRSVTVNEVAFSHNLNDSIDYLNDSDYIISGRLHGGIFAANLKKPLIYCANQNRNNTHNLHLGLSIGYSINNFVSTVSEATFQAHRFIESPELYIRNEKKYNSAMLRLKNDYDCLVRNLEKK